VTQPNCPTHTIPPSAVCSVPRPWLHIRHNIHVTSPSRPCTFPFVLSLKTHGKSSLFSTQPLGKSVSVTTGYLSASACSLIPSMGCSLDRDPRSINFDQILYTHWLFSRPPLQFIPLLYLCTRNRHFHSIPSSRYLRLLVPTLCPPPPLANKQHTCVHMSQYCKLSDLPVGRHIIRYSAV
jgi:hypothetical protein